MSYGESLQCWAVIRLLPHMQRITIRRFRRESDADGYLKALRRYVPEGKFVLLFDPPSSEAVDEQGTTKQIAHIHKNLL
ncbi:hypothetical protein H6F95_31090 [Cyanobacteria bacterium FACHB-471]|nr:hypothetical protein [Cyanobacteria bacterium FACHB-471]